MRRCALLCGLAAALALATAPGAGAQANQSCGWLFRISGDQLNVAFPDAAARYWIAAVPIVPGFHVELHGTFPHARYISFVTYDALTRAIDGIPDVQIAPDAGSSNPFLPGASRTATNRSYTVSVRDAALPPSGRAINTIYTNNGQSGANGKSSPLLTLLIYRVYEADQGLDIDGGVGLPQISLVADNGSQRLAIPTCPDHSLPSTQALTDALAAAGTGAGPDGLPPTQLGGQDPPVWLKYTNVVNGVTSGLLNNPRTAAIWPPVQAVTNALPSGGLYENPDNKYITTFDSAAYGDVLVFHGKAPTTPRTFLPSDTTMGSGQLRYWSMCSNMSTTQYLACVKDDEVSLDSSGYYTIVVSTAATRPSTASAQCGIEWLPKGPLPSAPIILRNMLPSPSFTQAVQNVPAQGQEQATLGPYYPRGRYFAHASGFDAFVAAHGGCGHLTWP